MRHKTIDGEIQRLFVVIDNRDCVLAQQVTVRLEEAGKVVTSRGADTDTLVASAKAYVAALSKLTLKRGQQHAQRAQGRVEGV